MMMGNIRIARRLLIGFGAVIALMIVVGLFSLQRNAALQTFNENLDTRDFAALENLGALNRSEDQMRGLRALALLSAYQRRDRLPAEPAERLHRRYLDQREQNVKILTNLEQSATSWANDATTSERAAGWRQIASIVNQARNDFTGITPGADRMFALIAAGDPAQASAASSAAEEEAKEYESRLAEARRAIQEQIQLGRTVLRSEASRLRQSVIWMLLAVSIVGVLLSLLIHQSIAGPLRHLGRVVERIGQGDLTQQVGLARRDEIGELGSSIDRMVTGLKNVATQIRTTAEGLNVAAAEILASTQQQAASTAEQAAAVQQANATMTEVAQSGAQIADRAKQVAASAQASSAASGRGVDAVRNTVAVIESIREQAEAVASNVVTLSERTQAVGDIITSVNEIAEQSHLLAVNAAIQAAVANEHGRAFAVVADEMKNLASQSKKATLQVRSILGDIQKGITSSVMLTEEAVKRVASGRQQAGVTEETITELTGSVDESSRAFQQIVAGSHQQQIGFEQVALAFRNIGTATQQTASATKQLEKAADNLNSLAVRLREAVGSYRI
jgi:methyl-accepting chemotaxis protein